MPRPRILLIGLNGQVGGELARLLPQQAELTAVSRADLDLHDAESIRRCVRAVAPRIVVNAAAYTAVDQAETEPEACRAINAIAPGVIAREAAKLDAWVVHFSTDYVFDGTARTPYVETDAPNPLSAYGRAKLDGEEAVRAATARHLIFRLCWVYADRGRNFYLTMRRLAGVNEHLRVVRDQVGCPTPASAISRAVADALRRLDEPHADELAGIYHLATAGQASWHEFAERIVASLPAGDRRARDVRPITTEEYPTPAHRPAYSVLDGTKLRRRFGLALPPWQVAFDQFLAGVRPAPLSALAA